MSVLPAVAKVAAATSCIPSIPVFSHVAGNRNVSGVMYNMWGCT